MEVRAKGGKITETIREQRNWERNWELEDRERTNCSDQERIDQATEA